MRKRLKIMSLIDIDKTVPLFYDGIYFPSGDSKCKRCNVDLFSPTDGDTTRRYTARYVDTIDLQSFHDRTCNRVYFRITCQLDDWK
jgi:hypothetical protein